MAKVKRLKKLDTKESPFVEKLIDAFNADENIYQYTCTCGNEIIYYSPEKINRLIKCLECLE